MDEVCEECGAGGECLSLVRRHGGPNKPLVGGGFGMERLLNGLAVDDMPRSEYVVWSEDPDRMLVEAQRLRKEGHKVETATNCSSAQDAGLLAKLLGAELRTFRKAT